MDSEQRKVLLFVTITALMISLFLANGAAAAGGFQISAAKVEGGAGSQVTVDFSAENAAGSEGGQFNLNFDQSLIKPVSIEPGDLILSAEGHIQMANLDYAPGELMFMWVTANADTKDSGFVCRITFDLLRDGTTAISFKDLIIVAGNGQTATASAGQIRVGTVTSGEGSVTEPDRETGAAEEDDHSTGADDEEPATGEDGKEVIGEDNEESENSVVADQVGINPILAVVPIIIIVALAVTYYLIKKTGMRKQEIK